MEKLDKLNDRFFNEIHRLGRITVYVVIATFVAVPLLMSLVYQIPMDVKSALVALGSLLSFMAPLAVGEVMAFGSVMGPSMYLSLMSGCTYNAKLPAMISSLQIENVDPHSKEGEIIKILAVGGSTITVTVGLFVGMLGLSYILPVLEQPVLAPAFSNIIPCMMGALLIPELLKQKTKAIFPLLFMVIVILVFGNAFVSKNQGYVIVALLVLTTLWDYFFIKRQESKAE